MPTSKQKVALVGLMRRVPTALKPKQQKKKKCNDGWKKALRKELPTAAVTSSAFLILTVTSIISHTVSVK